MLKRCMCGRKVPVHTVKCNSMHTDQHSFLANWVTTWPHRLSLGPSRGCCTPCSEPCAWIPTGFLDIFKVGAVFEFHLMQATAFIHTCCGGS